MEERRRKKQQQLLIRHYTRIGIVVAAVILLIVFLVRGVIGPLIHKGGSQDTEPEYGEVQTTAMQDASPEGTDGGAETASSETGSAGTDSVEDTESGDGTGTEESTETTESTSTIETSSSSSSLEAVRIPLKGVSDVAKAAYLTPGWHSDENGKWYQNPDGTYYANGFMTVDGTQYSFGKDGYVETGWITRGVKDYYFNEDGSYNPDKRRPMLCLTFDDGPGQYTMDLLNCLEENGAHATFFMVGQNVEYFPDEIKKMQEIGCELGNHSWDHTDLMTLDSDGVDWEMSSTDDALMQVCGQESTVCRAPGGSADESVYSIVQKPFILWSLDTEDWKLRDADLDYEAVMNGDLTDGSIILMHDIHEPSVEAAKRIIPDLVAQGYRLVTISEMAEAKDVTLQSARYTDFWDSSLANGYVAGYNG